MCNMPDPHFGQFYSYCVSKDAPGVCVSENQTAVQSMRFVLPKNLQMTVYRFFSLDWCPAKNETYNKFHFK